MRSARLGLMGIIVCVFAVGCITSPEDDTTTATDQQTLGHLGQEPQGVVEESSWGQIKDIFGSDSTGCEGDEGGGEI